MSPESISQTLTRLRAFFAAGKTRDVDFRIAQLKKLKEGIRKYEQEIIAALYDDFHKPPFESYASEIGILYTEIDHTHPSHSVMVASPARGNAHHSFFIPKPHLSRALRRCPDYQPLELPFPVDHRAPDRRHCRG